ncbi:MAG: hypothetical protein ACRDXX_21610 [Stackebrandtia sp.]
MTAQPPSPDAASSSRLRTALHWAVRVGGGVFTTYTAFALAVVEVFLTEFRLFGSPTPLAALLAIVGNVGLPWLTMWFVGHRGAALLPGATWFLVVVAAVSQTRAGDLMVIGYWPGMALLLSGAACVAVMGYLTITGGLDRFRPAYGTES